MKEFRRDIKKAFMVIKRFFLRTARMGEKISEDHLIKLDRRSMFFVVACLFLFSLAVSFKLHGSSVSMWDKTLKEDDTGIILGKAKSIRSDEWLVQTPSILSQVRKNFPVENDSIGADKAPLIRDLPTRHFVSIFQPHNWGFFFLDVERGFSWFWNFKIFGMIIGFFLLLMLLTGNNFWLSLFGSLWLFFSSFIQWWFSINMSQMMVYFSFMAVSFSYILFSRKKVSIIFSSVIFLLSFLAFIFLLYPPFQVPLVYLFIVLIAGLLIKRWEYFKEMFPLRLIFVVAVAFISGYVLYHFYLDAKSTIDLAINTAYPGERISTGGDVSLAQYFSGFFGYYLDQGKYPKNLGNVCEASNFIFLFPAVFGIIGYNLFRKRKNDILLWSVSSYLIVLSVWILFGFPGFLAKISLFSMVPGSRAVLGLGVAGIIAVVLFLNDKKNYEGIRIEKKYLILIFLALLASFYYMSKGLDNFLHLPKIITSGLIFSLVTYWLIDRKKILFSIAVLFLVFLPTYNVNPVSSGLSPILDKDLYEKVSKINKNDPDARWLVFGDRKIADFIKSTGAEVLNGVKFPPDIAMMEKLSGNKGGEKIYNRFAHIGFSESDSETASFNLKQTDYFVVNIDPCSERARDLNVKYIIFTDDPSESHLGCMTFIAETGKEKIFNLDGF